jgi:squalene-hopene/tetraprenyl-beta-curcumene cyclase
MAIRARSQLGLIFALTVAAAAIIGLTLVSGLTKSALAATDATPPAPAAAASTATTTPSAAAAAATPSEKPTSTVPVVETPTPTSAEGLKALAERRKAAIAKGVEFLVKTQAEDGSWVKGNVGISALCADSLLSGGKTIKDEPVRKAIEFLLKNQKPEGGIFDDSGLDNYTTSLAICALVKADAKAYSKQIAKAVEFLLAHQWGATENVDEMNYRKDGAKKVEDGGAGYGKNKRPDLSNTQFFVDALRAADLPKNDPAWTKVIIFISRCQASSETNDLEAGEHALVTQDDGGFFYTCAANGISVAGTVDLPGGKKGLRSYGSMTYAGFKSLLYAHLDPSDARAKAALEWIRNHWTFQENPELGQQGLYYYYRTAAKALKAYSEVTKTDTLLDARKRTHDWRAEMTAALIARQHDDGAWYNDSDRWFEGKEIAPVPTGDAIVALSLCE